MSTGSCYLCGADLSLVDDVQWVTCAHCEGHVHAPSTLRLAAIERLQRRVGAEAHLGDAHRADLQALLARQRGEVVAAALAQQRPGAATAAAAASPAETATPKFPSSALPPPLPPPLPPLPASPPLPLASPDAPADAAAAGAAANDTTAPTRWDAGPPVQRERARSTPGLWARLGPLFAENLLFALAGFLLIAGAVYFTTTAWTTMSGAMQKLVVAGALLLFAGLAHLAAGALGKQGGLRTASRVLSLVALALVPATGLVAGLLFASAPLQAVAVAGFAAAAGHRFLLALARREAAALPRLVTWLVATLVVVGVLAPQAIVAPVLSACAVGAMLVAMAWLLRSGLRATAAETPAAATSADAASADAAAAACALAAGVFAALAFVVGVAVACGPPLVRSVAPLGIVLAASAAAVALLESARAARSPATLVAAFATGVAAVLMATGDVRCVMVAAWAAAATGLLASLRLDRARLLVPALVLSAVGYLFLPAPVRELAAQLRAQAASQLGYEPQRLPLSFYGITFLPYLLGLAVLAVWFRRTERSRHRRVCSGFGITVAGGLAAMALLLGGDLRAPMMVLPADGLLLVGLGHLAHSGAAVLAGCLGVVGGLVCALLWWNVPLGVATAVLGAAALVLTWLARRPAAAEGFAATARRSVDLAALVVTIVVAVLPLAAAWPPAEAGAWNLLHATALLPLVLRTRTHGARSPVGPSPDVAGELLSLPALWATTLGVASVLATACGWTASEARPLALAVVTVVGGALLRTSPCRLGEVARRRLVVALFAFHVLLVPDLLQLALAEVRWSTVLGTAALAVAGGWLARRERVEALLALAVVEGTYPLHLLAGILVGSTAGPPGLVGPTALAMVAAWCGARHRALVATAGGITAAVSVILLAWRLAVLPQVPAAFDAAAALVVSLFAAGAPVCCMRARIVANAAPDAGTSLHLLAGAVAAVTGPLALLDLVVHGLHGYAWGMLAIAGIAFGVAARWRTVAFAVSVYGLGWLVAAVALLFVWNPDEVAAERWRLVAFVAALAAAMACRPRALRTATTLVAAASAFGAAVHVPIELRWLPVRWWMVVTVGGCGLALLLAAQPRFQSRARAVRGIALPIVALFAAALAVLSTLASAEGTAVAFDDRALADAHAAALVLAAAAAGLHARAPRRQFVWWVGATIAAMVTTPLNALLHGHRAIWFQPDAEVAALAVVAAIVGRTYARHAVVAAGAAALVWTGVELADVSTPVTVSLVAGAPLALLMRRQAGPWALVHGVLLVVAAWSWIRLALGDRSFAHLGPALALAAAAAGTWLGPWLRRVAGGEAVARQVLAVRAIAWLAALVVVLVVCTAGEAAMTSSGIAAALAATGLVAVGSARAAREPEMASLVHLALVAGVCGYLVLLVGTTVLQPLAGRHHHALTVVGASLFLLTGARTTAVARHLRMDAVVLPLAAIGLAVPFGGSTFALLAGALVMGLGAVVSRQRWLGALALMLANSGLFRLWLQQGVFDPSFYGVPAGLSLVFGAELARSPLGAARVTALRIVGLAAVYGSVLLQVARASQPLHAFVLFAFAMAAVAFGTLRQRAPILVTGVVAVVLDVVVYLGQRGFEQDFAGSVLLVGAGCCVFLVAMRAARRRARANPPAP